MKSFILAVAAMLAMGGASAQVFKSVGADGKITYSDRPSDQARGAVSVLKAPARPAAPAAAAPVASAAPGKVRTSIFQKWCVEGQTSSAAGDKTPGVMPAASITL